MRWLTRHATSPEAAAAVRRLARRHGITEAADDLRMAWYVRLLATMRRKAGTGERLGIADEDAAAAYAYVALRSCAVDLRAAAARDPMPADDAPEPPAIVNDPLTALALASVRAELRRRARVRRTDTSRAAVGSARTAELALTVLDLAVRPPMHLDVDEPAGGTREWDRLIYLALARLDGDACRGLAGRDTRLRQVKARCSEPVRELLADVLSRHGLAPTTDDR